MDKAANGVGPGKTGGVRAFCEAREASRPSFDNYWKGLPDHRKSPYASVKREAQAAWEAAKDNYR